MRSEHEEYNEAFQRTDAENASHYVHHEIRKLYTGTQRIEDVRKRWIWELLQNASDARNPNGDKLIIEVEYRTEEKLIFLHNGRGFKPNEIAHLVKSGTTKNSTDEKTQGKFGRGFLTTHLLSSTVDIAGLLDTDKVRKWFDFTLERDNESQKVLAKALERSRKAFIHSRTPNKPAIPHRFTTQFVFPIHKPGAKEAVTSGLDTLEQCAPYVIAFNQEFSSIKIKRPDRTLCFEYLPSDVSQIGQITVSENKNGKFSERQYLLASSEKKTSVAVPIELNGDSSISSSVENTPRLYSAFPLVGTDSYSFPAIINNPDFSLPPDRDGVQLDGGDPESLNNRTIVEESCEMLVRLLKNAASKHWNHEHLHRWTEIPNADHLALQTKSELKNCLRKLIEQIIHADVLLTQSGELTTPKNAILPEKENETENEGNIEVLWDLLNDWKKFREKLPRRNETVGWYRAVKSWKAVYGTIPTGLKRSMINVRRLVTLLANTCSSLKDLQNELQEDVCAVDWLNRLYTFLRDNELFDNEMRKRRIFLDQDNGFKQLNQLHRDVFGDEKLKDIAELLGWPIKSELYNTQLTTLDKIEGRPDNWDQDYVIGRLLSKLKDRAKNDPDNPDDKFKKASVDLFAWIVSEKEYPLLSDFPLFSETYDSGKTKVIPLLDRNPDDPPDKERPLAPVQSWQSDLQEYDELFPPRFIIAKDFFQAVENRDNIWEWLEDNGFIRKDVIFQYDSEVSFKDFLPQEPLSDGDHVTEKKVRVTKIAFLTESDFGIIERIRKSSQRARKFWNFLTKCVVRHDPEGLELTEIACANCDDNHQYYPAEWLKPVVDRSWIPIDRNTSDILKADNLANLFEEYGWDPGALNQNDPISKLLKAINISHLDLIRATFVPSNDLETVDNVITEMLRKSRGNVNHLNHAIKYIDAVTSNENLSDHVEDLLEATEDELNQAREILQYVQEDNESFLQEFEKSKDRADTINENRKVGERVEILVKQILEETFPNEKFKVKSVREGANIEGADIEIVELEVTQGKEKLWIEVKSTRNESNLQRVKMEPSQGKKAVEKKDNFLLCVVPIPKGRETDIETVRENMRFVADIGGRVASLCDHLKDLEEFREGITVDTPSGVRLDVEKTKAGILVKKSVWEKDGFRLEELIEHLTLTNNDLIT